MEEQAVHNLITGKSNQGNKTATSSQDKLQQALEDNKPVQKPEPEAKDEGILEQIGEGVVKLAKMYSSIEEQNRQLELEQSRAFCETLQTKEGQQMLTLGAGVLASILIAPCAAPALVGYLGVTTAAGTAIVTAGTYAGIALGTSELLTSATEGNSIGRIFTDTLQGTVDGFIQAMPAGVIDYKVGQIWNAFKGTSVYKSISKSLSKLLGIADDIDNVKIPVEDGNNTIIDDVVEEVVEGGSGSKIQEVLELADNYTLSDDVYTNHILDRHGPNSTYGNKSHFTADFDIKDAIDSTLRGDNFIVGPNTNGRAGYIFEQTFSYQIGTNSKGQPLYTLKVVIDEAGNVVTAFPKK